jgi:5-dehydro-4-deoxyglucarate dehydratase
LDLDRFANLVERLVTGGASALFPAAGAGELFSLSLHEYEDIVREAVRVVGGRMSVIPGVGYGLGLATEFAQCAERAGADAILLMPPYLVQSEQEGLGRHVRAIASRIGIGIILYARDNATYSVDLLDALATDCPNLIGLKDGVGDFETLLGVCRRLAGRLVILGGLPTAELFALPYRALGVTSYSSAAYNFAPFVAMRFFRALETGPQTVNELLDSFYLPMSKLRTRRRGYAVSIVKAGLRVSGHDCGPVRPPLVDFSPEEAQELLLRLIEANA